MTETLMTETFLSKPDHAGCVYDEFLLRLHSYLKPKTYLEIGTLYGDTLALANCPSIAIDPLFRLKANIIGQKDACFLFQMSSDDFFAKYDPKLLLGSPVHMGFLDGMHWFEFALRGFINIEAHCRNNSVILLHDCLPTDSHAARRNSDDASLSSLTPHSEWWAGDTWKCISVLKKHRPDLEIYCFDAPPTGLVAITNLCPTSSLLRDAYFRIIREYRDLSDRDGLEVYFRSLNILHTEDYRTPAALSSLFWV